MRDEEELNSLEYEAFTPRSGVLTVTLRASSVMPSEDVLRRSREVLREVVAASRGSEWPSLLEWNQLLPRWFVDACGPELSREEAQAWMEEWRRLTPAEKAASEERERWSLPGWLHWFAPGDDQRQWCWLSGKAIGRDRLEVVIEVPGYPTAYGALVWLLRAAGAERVWEV
jgi:hypothetical protein